MAPHMSTLLADLRLTRSRDVARWYGEVVVAWDSLRPAGDASGHAAQWRNLGYWPPGTTTLEQACRQLATVLADATDVRAGHDVLDVGCGFGESTFLLWERLRPDRVPGRPRLVGLDLTPEHIDSALARRRAAGPEFVVGDAVDPPFPPGSFDRVLALECAFHFPDRRRFFSAAYRLLRPGGVLGLADVVVRPWFAGTQRVLDRVVPGRARRALHELAADILKMPTANLVDLGTYCAQLRASGLSVRGVEDISDRVFPHFMRYWRRAQDPARQEELLRATGISAGAARDAARAWRRQMAVLMFGWRMSRFVVVTAQRPDQQGDAGG